MATGAAAGAGVDGAKRKANPLPVGAVAAAAFNNLRTVAISQGCGSNGPERKAKPLPPGGAASGSEAAGSDPAAAADDSLAEEAINLANREGCCSGSDGANGGAAISPWPPLPQLMIAPYINPNVEPIMPNPDSEGALSLDAKADKDDTYGAAAVAGAPMEDCGNDNPLLAAGAGANSSFLASNSSLHELAPTSSPMSSTVSSPMSSLTPPTSFFSWAYFYGIHEIY